MPQFVPFKAVRPPRDRAHLVGSRSYINYSTDDLKEKLVGNPFTFLHVIMPELRHKAFNEMPMEERFKVVRKEYKRFIKKGHLIQDVSPCFYLYRQTKGKQQYVGLIGGVAAEDYANGKIKKHEQTLTKRENIFKRYLESTSFNAEPVLLAYEDCDRINKITKKLLKQRAEYEFLTTDKVKHEMWVIDQPEIQHEIQQEFDRVPELYIADGHHRCASSALLSKECSGEDGSQKGHFMAMLIPKSSLKIFEYNRMIADLNHLTTEAFLGMVGEYYTIKKKKKKYQPKKSHVMGMYLDQTWYRLKLKKLAADADILHQLDTRILTKTILEPILGIGDLKTDSRVGFLSGTNGLEKMEAHIDSGEFKVGFSLYPVSFDQLKEVSDLGLTMPPKSTWIEPKLRSGLTIYNLFQE